MGTPFRYSHGATRSSVRERWQQPPCIGRLSSHAHTRRRLESALTSSQVGAGVAPLSRPEFITCAQPVWPGWYVQPVSSSECMPDWV
eukprot:scaffold28030_cov72-Phaeocystis_antarctica.AAC.3